MSADEIRVFEPQALLEGATPAPVPVPIGDLISMVRSAPITNGPSIRYGAWECSPGVWQRQITQAEFCFFIEGEAIFRPADGAEPLRLSAGQAAFFPANSLGVWEILSRSRKVFIIFDAAETDRA